MQVINNKYKIVSVCHIAQHNVFVCVFFFFYLCVRIAIQKVKTHRWPNDVTLGKINDFQIELTIILPLYHVMSHFQFQFFNGTFLFPISRIANQNYENNNNNNNVVESNLVILGPYASTIHLIHLVIICPQNNIIMNTYFLWIGYYINNWLIPTLTAFLPRSMLQTKASTSVALYRCWWCCCWCLVGLFAYRHSHRYFVCCFFFFVSIFFHTPFLYIRVIPTDNFVSSLQVA